MASIDLNKYLNERIELDTLGLWHILKVLVSHTTFENEPILTPIMGTRSYDCSFCRQEQQKTNRKHMFCKRHLMLFELRKFYIVENVPVFKLKDIIIFKHKYAYKKFQNVTIASFSDKHISKVDLVKLLKFSFLTKDIPLLKTDEIYDISELLTVKDDLVANIDNHKIVLRNGINGMKILDFE